VRIQQMPMDALWEAGARTLAWEAALLTRKSLLLGAMNPLPWSAMLLKLPVILD